MAGFRLVDTPPVPEQVAAGYLHRVHDLAATFAEWEDPAVVLLTEDAGQVRRAAAEQVEAELRPGGSLHDMREWGNKLSGATLRLAGLLHVAHHPADAWRRPIDAQRTADAVRLAEFFAAHYRAAVAAITADATTETARRVLAIVTAKGMATFTRRELHRRCHRATTPRRRRDRRRGRAHRPWLDPHHRHRRLRSPPPRRATHGRRR